MVLVISVVWPRPSLLLHLSSKNQGLLNAVGFLKEAFLNQEAETARNEARVVDACPEASSMAVDRQQPPLTDSRGSLPVIADSEDVSWHSIENI